MPPATCLPATWPAASPTRRAEAARRRSRATMGLHREGSIRMKFRDKLAATRATTAKVWALTTPFFSSDQKWKARALLAAIVLLNLGAVYMLVQINEWNRRVLRRAGKARPAGVLGAAAALHLAGVRLHRHRGLQVLPDPAAGDALARLDDRALPAALAVGPGVLPDGAGALLGQRRHAGQPGPAHPGRPEPVHHLQRLALHGPAQCGGDPGQLRRHSLVPERRFRVHPRRQHLRDRRLHGLGRAWPIAWWARSSPTTSGARRST